MAQKSWATGVTLVASAHAAHFISAVYTNRVRGWSGYSTARRSMVNVLLRDCGLRRADAAALTLVAIERWPDALQTRQASRVERIVASGAAENGNYCSQ